MGETDAEVRFRSKSASVGLTSTEADYIIALIQEDPDYFLNQGGSDGTYSHMLFHVNYGDLMPEIADLAVEFGGEI